MKSWFSKMKYSCVGALFGGASLTAFALTAQSISGFMPATPLTFSNNLTFALTATGGGSGNPVIFASTTPAVCTVSVSTVTILTAGTCTLTASQAGNGQYNAAPQVTRNVVVKGIPQTMTFAALSARAFNVPAFGIEAGVDSGLPVTFTSSTNAVCGVANTVPGNATVTPLAVGTCTIMAVQAGDATHASVQLSRNLLLTKVSQTIGISLQTSASVGGPAIDISASATSGLPVSLSVLSTAGICSLSGTSILPLAVGTCQIAADQAGDSTYAAAPRVTRNIAIKLKSQTIVAPVLSNKTLLSASIALAANATSGLTVASSSTTPAICTVADGQATLVAVGTCKVAFNQTGDAVTWAAAPQVVRAFAVSKATQTISVDVLIAKLVTDAPYNVAATATSGLPVTLTSSTPAVCTVNGTTVALVSAGTCTIVAAQSGNDKYGAAASVSRAFAVKKVAQSIQFSPVGTQAMTSGTVAVTATASSGLPVVIISATPTICTFAGSAAVFQGAGVCTLHANQAGDATYAAASQAGLSFRLNKAAQSISFAALGARALNAGPFSLTATASSGLPITYSTNSTACSVVGGVVNLLAAGSCAIVAGQDGNALYAAAPKVARSFAISKNVQTITFTPIASTPLSAGSVTANAGASSGLPVAIASRTVTVCTIVANSVALLKAGTCTLTANQAGNAGYAAAKQVAQSFVITAGGLSAQAIAGFAPASPVNYQAGLQFALSATGGLSGNALIFDSLTPEVCTVAGNLATVLAAGTCTLTADQAGNAQYQAAQQVTADVVVKPMSQSISFGAIADKRTTDAPFNAGAVASSGLPVSLESSTPSSCSVSGAMVTLIAAGTCTVVAKQAGNNMYMAAPDATQSFSIAAGAPPVKAIGLAVGWQHACALTDAGGVKCWGAGYYGQLGSEYNLSFDFSSIPLDVAGLSAGVASISAGARHTCAVMANGGVKCWGDNGFGKLGDGTTQTRNTPVDVVGIGAPVVAVRAAGDHTCALTVAGGVKCWGINGQLGNGSGLNSSAPVDVAGLTSGVASLHGSGDHTCARLSADGSLRCWGANFYGQLGSATPTIAYVPVVVNGLTGMADVQAGRQHTCALAAGGGIKCWGDNSSGQLGDNTTTTRKAPGNVIGLPGSATLLASGFDGNCAQLSGGTYCWGRVFGAYDSPAMHPTAVEGVSPSVTALGVGYGYACALTTTGAVQCWGDNNWYQLGDGTSDSRDAAADVVGFQSGGSATSQTIDFPAIGDQPLREDTPFMISATSSAGLPVYFASLTPSVCRFYSGDAPGWLYTFVQGDCTIAALQPGNAQTLAAPQVVRRFHVSVEPKTQTLYNINLPASLRYPWEDALLLTAIGGDSGNPVIYASLTPNVCKVLNGWYAYLMLNGIGTCTLTLDQAGDESRGYLPAPQVVVDIAVLPKLSQIITGFNPPATMIYADGLTFTVSASSGDSGNPVRYGSLSESICTVSGNKVSVWRAGLCRLTADQWGFGDYNDADTVIAEIVVTAKANAITGFNPATPIVYQAGLSFALGAGGQASTPIMYTSSTPAVCTANGNTASIQTAGTCTLTASQAADAYYAAAGATVNVVITKATQSIAFAAIGNRRLDEQQVVVLPVASSNLPVTLAANTPASCAIAGSNVINLLAQGHCSITASQGGDVSYEAAAPVTREFEIAGVVGRQWYFVHPDHLGTPRTITRAIDNNVVWTNDNTEPFGNSQPNSNPTGLGNFDYFNGFLGQYRDKETGTNQNWFRDYRPDEGRYVQSDLIGLKGGINTYAYVANNPIIFVDPTGEILISQQEGQKVVNEAKTWRGAEYYQGGGARSTRRRADCSGATWGIYVAAGFPYQYSSSATFPNNPRFKPSPGNAPQQGDVGWWRGHVLIYDANAGSGYNSWSARQPGKLFGPASTDWWGKNVKWFRYDKPDSCKECEPDVDRYTFTALY